MSSKEYVSSKPLTSMIGWMQDWNRARVALGEDPSECVTSMKGGKDYDHLLFLDKRHRDQPHATFCGARIVPCLNIADEDEIRVWR